MYAIIHAIKRRFFSQPTIIPRAEHTLSRAMISGAALKVLYRLIKAGYDAYLVGGGVRDLLLQRTPKDFDMVTNATPEEIRTLFRNSRIIGRRFRLVHVYYPDEIIEVSTFRGKSNNTDSQEPTSSDNTYGTFEEDAWRRDFTINALYYNIRDFSVIDFTGGRADLEAGCIRMIGDPHTRFHEDPVRLLRALRLAAKLQFKLHDATEKAILELGHLLANVPSARLSDEVTKLFFEGNAYVTFQLLHKMGYIKILFPGVEKIIKKDKKCRAIQLINLALTNTDQRFHNQQRLNPSYLLAVFLWPVLTDYVQSLLNKNHRFSTAIHPAIKQTINEQSDAVLITRRTYTMVHEMWMLQFHLEKRRPRRVLQLLDSRYFRAGFDLLAMRAHTGEVAPSLVAWWDTCYHASPSERERLVELLG